jgi:hypothetical protein
VKGKWKLVAASLVAAATAVAAPLAMAAPAGAATNQYIASAQTGHNIGNSAGNNGLAQDNENQAQDLYYEYQVADTGGLCRPFACGNGLNSKYAGDNVWVVYEHNTSYCWQTATTGQPSYELVYQSGVCGASHSGSLYVQTAAPDGAGSSEGWVGVTASNQSGSGQYLSDPYSGANLTFIPYHAYDELTFTVYGA